MLRGGAVEHGSSISERSFAVCLLWIDCRRGSIRLGPHQYRIGGAGRVPAEEIGKPRVHQIVAGMAAEKLPDGFALDVAVFDHEVIAGREKTVKLLQNRGHVMVRVFDDEPGMRL